MTEPVICTIIAKNYLAYARCLVDSFLEQHPQGRAFALLIDDFEGYFDPAKERFTTVRVEDVGIPEFWVMAFRYTILELSTAVKPFFLAHLFEQYGYEKLCYFDPDIYFYEPIEEIWNLLDSYGVVLIPHLTGFLNEENNPNELTIMRSGVYNLGFIGLSRHPELESLLHWWQEKLSKYCVVALERGLFVDQRWMDLAPALFSSVHIHRDPGCNVAYWNLYHRTLKRRDGKYTADGSSLKFFHFSGFSPDQTRMISKHQDRFAFRDLPHLEPLFAGYRECLLAHGYETTKNWPYTYNFYDDMGVRIPDAARTLWRELETHDPSWNPFDTSSGDRFVENLLAWLNEPIDEASSDGLVVTRLALALFKQRTDLKQEFPDVLGHDRLEFVRWFVNWGRGQFALDDFFVQPMDESLARYMESRAALAQQGFRAWFYQRVTNWLFRIGVGSKIERLLGPRLVGRVRKLFVRSDRTRPVASKSLPSLGGFQREDAKLGVNVVGYLCDETGVGESARATLLALHHQGFPVARTMVRSHTARKNDQSVMHLPEGNPHDVNLFYVNADQTKVVFDELGASFFTGKYNIAYWAWELDRFPDEWFDRFQYLDEIWVGSRFVQNTLAHVSPIPVLIMGVGMDKSPDPDVTRGTLGLPEDKFLFLFTFDMLSVYERKNPLATVQAFQRAFGVNSQETALVIKVTNLDRFQQYRNELENAVASVSGVLIDGYLDRSELDGLFNVCDAYVSLHRSEGFGMTIAEAMYLGKPVIATAYAGNVDFANVSNSYPVGFHLVELEQDYGPYKKGGVWAEPDLDHAAEQMRRVFEDRDEAQRKGRRAAADIRRWYGREAMAQKIIERLRIISAYSER